jgi:hypothetical protein
MRLFGLLHTAAGRSSAPNTKVRDEEKLFQLYVRNTITLWRSLDRAGIAFTLICSEPRRVRTTAARFGASDLELHAIPFPLEIPFGIPFYSAHHKIDVFRHLASLPERSYVGVVDLDVIALGDLPTTLARVAEHGTPLAYDITDQVAPAFGRDVIVRDLETITGAASEGRWFGGEFLAGRPSFFRSLVREVDRCYAVYVREWRQLHHQGDEILTSGALATLRRHGLELADAGTLGIARRYWSVVTRHPQPKFDDVPPAFLMHLPADKNFLATLHADEQVDAVRFLVAYRRHLRRRAMPNLARRVLMRLRDGRRTRTPAPA